MKNRLIKKDLLRLIQKARKVARDDGREIAGLLIHNGHHIEILETRNTYHGGGHFRFDERQIKAIEKAVRDLGHEIIGTFHSHPVSKAEPGPGDIRGALDDSLMLIIDCIGNEASLWKIRNGKARKMHMEIVNL